MADGGNDLPVNNDNNSRQNIIVNNIINNASTPTTQSVGSSLDEVRTSGSIRPLHLDLGDDVTHLSTGAAAAGSTSSRLDSNPFSFKHFLRTDAGTSSGGGGTAANNNNYQSKGARPKVYYDGRPVSSISDIEMLQPETGAPLSSPTTTTNNKQQHRIVPEFSSALPDFVQDHLVIEQCFLGGGGTNNNPHQSDFSFDITNNYLPDFTCPSRGDSSININRISSLNNNNHHDGGAAGCSSGGQQKTDSSCRRMRTKNNDLSIPLDLPATTTTNHVDFPLDLPTNTTNNNNTCCYSPVGGAVMRNNCSTSEVGISKSLPDFLADGAVCSQNVVDSDFPSPTNNNSPDRGGGETTDRLRNELDIVRRQLHEQTLRSENLNRELEIARTKEHEFTRNLTKTLKQFEENLSKSNMKSICAENTILVLKEEIKTLSAEINDLKMENRNLRSEDGATGGGRDDGYYRSNDLHSQRLAKDLRGAANNAEHSLRQLLTGVDNLRMMAASLENQHRIEERTTKSFLDLDLEDSGAAL